MEYPDESWKHDLTARTDVARFLVYSADIPFFRESVVLKGTIRELPESEWDAHEAALDNAWLFGLFERADSTGEVLLYEFVVEDQQGAQVHRPPAGDRRTSG